MPEVQQFVACDNLPHPVLILSLYTTNNAAHNKKGGAAVGKSPLMIKSTRDENFQFSWTAGRNAR